MADIFFDQKNHGGIITLDRSKALNSLSHEMIIAMRNHLLKWREDPKIKFVLIKSNNDKAFCAGGDIKELYALHERKDTIGLEKFFADEYGLNKIIFNYPKPYISMIHGINMGGGMGVSIHGDFRIISENVTLAMPEVYIGLFPDAMATHFFSRCPGVLGIFLGLTGYYMNAADALYSGIATHYVPKENFDLLLETLINAPLSSDFRDVVQEVVEMFSTGVPPMVSELEKNRSLIEDIFDKELEEIEYELAITKNMWLKAVARKLLRASPLSLKITHKMLRESAAKNFEDIFRQDMHLARFFIKNSDFFEGIRSMLIDRDNQPKWKFHSIDLVSESSVSDAFRIPS